MRRFPIRRFFTIIFFLALALLFSEGGSLQVARADVKPTQHVLTATGPIGLGFNYTGAKGLVVVYVASGMPPATIPATNPTYCQIVQLPNGVTGSPPVTGNTPTIDEGAGGSLYVYAQMQTPGCGAQTELSPLSFQLPLLSGGTSTGNIMVAWTMPATVPGPPANYSDGALVFGSGMTATWDSVNGLTFKQQTAGVLYVFAQCGAGMNTC